MEQRMLRNEDFSLDDEHIALRDAFASFFTKECPTTVVRAAEPDGFDADLWDKMMALDVTTMGLPESLGGDGAGLVELVLTAEEYGRALAPVPMIETMVAGRVLAASSTNAEPWLRAQMSGERIITLGLQRAAAFQRQLVPAGAVADAVIALHDDVLILVADSPPHRQVANQACAPLAWWAPADGNEPRLWSSGGAEGPRTLREA